MTFNQQTVKEAEEESLEEHKHLLERRVKEGLGEAMDEQKYQLTVQTTTEERRKVGNNLQRL